MVVLAWIVLFVAGALPSFSWAQQPQESPEVRQSRQQAVSLAQNRALEGCYGASSDLGANLYQAQERIRQLEAQLKTAQDAAKPKQEESKQEESKPEESKPESK